MECFRQSTGHVVERFGVGTLDSSSEAHEPSRSLGGIPCVLDCWRRSVLVLRGPSRRCCHSSVVQCATTGDGYCCARGEGEDSRDLRSFHVAHITRSLVGESVGDSGSVSNGTWLEVPSGPEQSLSRRRRDRRRWQKQCSANKNLGGILGQSAAVHESDDARASWDSMDGASIAQRWSDSVGYEWYAPGSYTVLQSAYDGSTTEHVSRVRAPRWLDGESTTGCYLEQNTVEAHLRKMLAGSWRPSAIRCESSVFPLHLKDVSRVNLVAADAIIDSRFLEAWNFAKQLLMTPLQFDSVAMDLELTPQIADLNDIDINDLLRFNIIEEFDEAQALNYVKIFTVEEPDKGRRRMINWPQAINELFPEVPNVQLPSYQEIEKEIASGQYWWASTFDIAAFYHHFALPADMLKYYCFQHKTTSSTKTYALKVIPTGQRHCPVLGQCLSGSIALKVESRTKSIYELARIRCFAYVDNFFLLADSEITLQKAEEILVELCNDLRITLSRDSFPSGEAVFMGVSWNLHAVHCDLAEKSVRKLSQALQDLRQWQVMEVPFRQALKVFGLMVFAGRIKGLHLANAYTFLKFLRRHGRSPVDASVRIWKCAIDCACCFIDQLLRMPPRVLMAEDDSIPWILYSDASLSGWGTVIISPCGDIKVFAGPFEYVEDIQVLETRALLRAVQRLPFSASRKNLFIRIDNTSLVSLMSRHHHRNFVMNSLLPQIMEVIATKGFHLADLRWVSSLANIADLPSRLWAGPALHEDNIAENTDNVLLRLAYTSGSGESYAGLTRLALDFDK